MKRQQRIDLRNRLRQKISLAFTQALSKDETSAVEPTLREVENYSKLLAMTQPPWAADAVIALVIAIICLAAAGFLWNTKVRRTNISLVAETTDLRGKLTRDWRVGDSFQAHVMHFDGVSAAHDPALGLSLNSPSGRSWFRLDGGQITLDSLEVDKDASVHAHADNFEVDLSITGAPFQGTVLVIGKGTLTAGTMGGDGSVNRPYDLPVPEPIDFTMQDKRNAAEISIHAPQPWTLGQIPFGSLTFDLQTPQSPITNELSSGIRSGSLQLNQTSWPVFQLFEHEFLSIHQVDAARIQVRSGHDALHVSLNGFASGVKAGDAEQRSELAPSYLEYLYDKKSLALFWGTVVFVWGLLWGIRRTIFR